MELSQKTISYYSKEESIDNQHKDNQQKKSYLAISNQKILVATLTIFLLIITLYAAITFVSRYSKSPEQDQTHKGIFLSESGAISTPMAHDNLEGLLIKDRFGNLYKILNEFQRDEPCFTEGFSYITDDKLLESCGGWNYASIHYLNIDRKLKKITKQQGLEQHGNYFGEGSDIFLNKDSEPKIYQLTWDSHLIFEYDIGLTKLERTFNMTKYIPKGWGMTHDWQNKSLAYIDTGDEYIYKADSTKDFALFDKVKIFDPENPKKSVKNVNEIEFVDGELWGNHWQTNLIYRIDPNSGEVLGKYDFSALYSRAHHLYQLHNNRNFDIDDVLNGIAYDRKRKTFYLTGKNWTSVYEIQLVSSYNKN